MPNIAWDLIWRDRGVVRGLNNVSDATDKAERRAKAFKVAVGVGLVAAGAAAVKFGADSVRAYSEAQAAQQKLGFAFQKFPKLADTNQVALQRLNTELQKKTRFDDDATAAAQASLAQYRLTGTQITQLTPLLQDYAARTGKDLPTAAKDLGKAVLGNGKALKAVGLNFKDTGTEAGNFQQLMGGLRTQVGGFAEKEGKTAAGQLEILHNQFGELQEAAGKQLLPAVTAVVGGLTTLVEIVGDNSDVIVPLVGTVGGLTAALWLGSKAAKAFSVAQGLLSTAANSNSRVIGGLASVVSKAGPWGLAIGAGATLLGLFAGKQALAERETKAFTDSLTFQKGALDANSQQMLTQKLATEGTLDAAKRAGVSEADYVRALLKGGPARDALINQLYDTEASAHASADALEGNVTEHLDVAAAAGTAADTLKLMGGDLDASKRAADQAGGAYVAAAAGLDDQEAAAANLTKAYQGLNTELQKSIDKFTILKEGALSAGRADMAWEEAIDSVSDSVKQNGRSLNNHTAKGRANREAIIGMASALNDKVTADVKEAGKVRSGETALEAYRRAQKVATRETKDGEEKIRAIGRAHHLNTREVNAMINKYLKTPAAAGDMGDAVADAAGKVRGFGKNIKALRGKNIDIHYSTNADEMARAFNIQVTNAARTGGPNRGGHDRRGGVMRASGGLIRGPGTGTSDSILGMELGGAPTAWVSNGEYVVNARQTRKNLDVLEAINGGQDLPRRAGGGVVARPDGVGAYLRGGTSGVIAVPDADALSERLARKIGGRLGHAIGSKLDRARDSAGSFGGAGVAGVGHLAAAALSQVGSTAWGIGQCLKFVRSMAGAPGGTYDASAAWRNARYKHRGDHNVPSSVPVYWGGGHGHIAASIGGGRIVTTDFPRTGRIGLTTISRLQSAWGKPYLGWANDVNGRVTSRYGLSSGGVVGVGVGEHGPERVLSAAQTRTFDRMVRVMDSRGAGNTYMVNISAPNYIGSRQELRKTMVDMVRSGAFEVVKR